MRFFSTYGGGLGRHMGLVLKKNDGQKWGDFLKMFSGGNGLAVGVLGAKLAPNCMNLRSASFSVDNFRKTWHPKTLPTTPHHEYLQRKCALYRYVCTYVFMLCYVSGLKHGREGWAWHGLEAWA